MLEAALKAERQPRTTRIAPARPSAFSVIGRCDSRSRTSWHPDARSNKGLNLTRTSVVSRPLACGPRRLAPSR
jgi:hypothetical protein